MPLHPVSDYIDVMHTPFPRLFEGVGEVWDVLPGIGPFLQEWLEPSVEGDLRGEVHMEGPVFIGPGVRIMHGTTILGPVYIGAGSFIGPGCYLRPNTIIGENCIIGNSCELKNCIIADSAEIPHWNYVGDSLVGHKAHLGAGVILSNWRHDHGSIPVLDDGVEGGKILTGLAKFGAIIGDHADLGSHAVLNPGSLIGRRSVLYGGVVWRGVLPADRIVKLRQELEIAARRNRWERDLRWIPCQRFESGMNDLFPEVTSAPEISTLEVGRFTIPVYTGEFWTAKQRAAHSLHEISYRACYKPQLPAFFMERYGKRGQTVFDPFLGRGTTLIEAQLRGFKAAGSDINPLCLRLAAPRLTKLKPEAIRRRLEEVRLETKALEREDLLAFFHPDTLSEIEGWRRYLGARRTEGTLDAVDEWIEMVASNRLTGHSPGFFSVYSMPPNQAVTAERQLLINAKLKQQPVPRDTRAIIFKKTRSLLKDLLPDGYGTAPPHLFVSSADALKAQPDASVDLVVTSPPFLNVVDYELDNWMRMWFCGCEVERKSLWKIASIPAWGVVMQRSLAELRRIVRPGGVIAFEVGEVRKGKVKLEEEIARLGVGAGLVPEAVFLHVQDFTKTANCWGVDNNKGGTNSNRIVVFRKQD